jgi:hypothetical protein
MASRGDKGEEDRRSSRGVKWLPKQIDPGVREIQESNGLLNTPDSCKHDSKTLKLGMVVTLHARNSRTPLTLLVTECCASFGVLKALQLLARAGYDLDRSKAVHIAPVKGLEYWFDPMNASLVQ